MTAKVYGERFAVLPDSVLYAEVSSHAKVLWAILARHADPIGHCFPGRTRLAALMGVSPNTIKRAKAELIQAKLIECHERYDEAGRRTTDDVFLAQARATGGPTGRATGGPTEVDPEEEHHYSRSDSGCSSVGGAKNAPPAPLPIRKCEQCAEADARFYWPLAKLNLCPRCYEAMLSPTPGQTFHGMEEIVPLEDGEAETGKARVARIRAEHGWAPR